VPSKPIFACVPSQNGLWPEWPQRQSANLAPVAGRSLPIQLCDCPLASVPMVCSDNGTEPVTKYGPLRVTVIRMVLASCFIDDLPPW
jgi:hypothetical protein